MNIALNQNQKVMEEAVASRYSDIVKITSKGLKNFRVTPPLLMVFEKPLHSPGYSVQM